MRDKSPALLVMTPSWPCSQQNIPELGADGHKAKGMARSLEMPTFSHHLYSSLHQKELDAATGWGAATD